MRGKKNYTYKGLGANIGRVGAFYYGKKENKPRRDLKE